MSSDPLQHKSRAVPPKLFGEDDYRNRLPEGDFGRAYRSVWNHLIVTEFEQKFIDVGGLRTRYARAGRSGDPKVLMLHGTGGHWESFAANLDAFSKHFECFAIDMAGCGFTDKPDKATYEIADYVEHIVAFLDTMQIDRVHVVGVSLGTWVGAGLARDHPERVDRIVMVASSGMLQMPPSAQPEILDRAASATDHSWEHLRKVVGHLLFDQELAPDDYVAIRQRIYADPNIDVILPRMLTLAARPEIRGRNLLTEQEWRNLESQILIVAHVDSPDQFLRSGELIIEYTRRAAVLVVHQSSHWSHFEDPQRFNKHAIAWLRGLPDEEILDKIPEDLAIGEVGIS